MQKQKVLTHRPILKQVVDGREDRSGALLGPRPVKIAPVGDFLRSNMRVNLALR
jgi:hypothetical protein